MGICIKCYDTGEYLGQGMMMAVCDVCYPPKKATPHSIPKEEIDRKSDSYKTAIKEIMDLNPSITKKQAVKMFDEAYDKK